MDSGHRADIVFSCVPNDELTMPPINSFKPVVSQMALIKLSGLQRKIQKRHCVGRGLVGRRWGIKKNRLYRKDMEA